MIAAIGAPVFYFAEANLFQNRRNHEWLPATVTHHEVDGRISLVVFSAHGARQVGMNTFTENPVFAVKNCQYGTEPGCWNQTPVPFTTVNT